jgi:hypothetical protein
MRVTLKSKDLRGIMKDFFRVLNAVQPAEGKQLTQSEITVLVEFCILPAKFEYHRFSKVAKKVVFRELEKGGWKLSSQSLNSKLYSMIEKDFLWRDEDKVIYLKPYLKGLVKKIIASTESKGVYNILFSLEVEHEEETVSGNG